MTLGDNQMIFPANRTDYGSAEISRMSTFLTARENQGDDALSFPDYKVATDFPLDALPESIRAAVIEICRRDKLAAPIAVQATLAAVSVACQDLVLVDRGFGETSVCSLFMLVVADSGARKTRADRAVTPTIEAYDRRAKVEYGRQKSAYEIELKNRQDMERGLQRTLMTLIRKTRSTSEDKAADVEARLAQVEEELGELRSRPFQNPKPRFRRMLYSAISIREIERGLCENWPAAGLVSNEAADFLNARSDSDMARLDRIWDGQGIDVVGRTPRDTFSVSDPRLTMSLMIQPSVFDSFLEKKGERAKTIGFIPRMLIARPETIYGTRTIDSTEQRSTVWIDRFNSRIQELLDAGNFDIAARARNRVCLRFSPAAQLRWEREHDEKERGMADGGKYVYEREFVNRYSEHVARLAALFHFFASARVTHTDSDDMRIDIAMEIGEQTLVDAIKVANWYLDEFSRIFNPDKSIKEAAKYVYKKLLDRVAAANGGRVPERATTGDANIRIRSNELREFCHRFGLKNNPTYYDTVLAWLNERSIVRRRSEKVGSSTKGTEFVLLDLSPPGHGYRLMDDGSLEEFLPFLKQAQAHRSP
ncbi:MULTISPECIES: YfjI family protein [Burkholderia]|uniref:YfjI family protein n=1 Tax=Burkholderia TaxID=32008 RepID=UPI0009E3BD38|nr:MULTISPECIES: YfjI family protein [Burkholderia]